MPVIYAASGNCHVYVDASADLESAEAIVLNAKVQRPGVCNAAETLLIHEDIAAEFVPRIVGALGDAGVRVRGDERRWRWRQPASRCPACGPGRRCPMARRRRESPG